MGGYRLLPEPIRAAVSRVWVRRMMHGARFRTLPPVVPADPQVDDCAADFVDMATSGHHLEGVNLFAYFRGRFGLAEAARSYARALAASGYPVALIDVDLQLPHDFNETALDNRLGSAAPFDIGIVFVNPDYLDAALESIGQARLAGRALVACWFWELENVPQEWQRAASEVDGILVASAFVEEAFRKVTDTPVFRVPLPLFKEADSGLGREAFGLVEGDFVFLASFDFHSGFERKNPRAVLQAFREAFPRGDEPVGLVVKTSNGEHYPELFTALARAASTDRRILIRDDVLPKPHLRALQRSCDAYVSLHRAEGFGLGMAECMAQGKPVVATAWSGNMEFMTPDNSCLVGFSLVPVPEGGYLDARAQRWAEPDVSEAAEWMRRLAAEPQLATRIGEIARQTVRSQLDPRLAADRIGRFIEMVRDRAASRAAGGTAAERAP